MHSSDVLLRLSACRPWKAEKTVAPATSLGPHPQVELKRAVRQAAWDRYFRADPVCAPPDFVADPGIDLDALLRGQPVLIPAACGE